jgi:hypothetical protein
METKANMSDTSPRQENGSHLDILIERVQSENKKKTRQLRSWYIIMGIGFLLYLIPTFAFPILFSRYLFISIGFLIYCLLMYQQYRSLRKLDYSLPMIEFLRRTRDHFTFSNLRLWIASFAFFLICFAVTQYLTGLIARAKGNMEGVWIIFLLIFLGIYIGAITFAWFDWRKKYKPILEEIDKTLLEANN